jgi:hypothetical protein
MAVRLEGANHQWSKEGYALRDHRAAQPRDQCRAREPDHQSTPSRGGHHAEGVHSRGVPSLRGGRGRKVG